MDNSGAYGAGKAQGFGFSFDPIEFVKRPLTILRLLSWFFAIIVFSCISTGGYVEDICIMKGDKNCCGFGVFVGVLAFIACMLFLVADILFEKLSSVQHRKYVVMADLGFSAAWSFLFFVAFCYMTNKWTTTSDEFLMEQDVQSWQKSNVRASIAFSFFSIPSFAALAYLAFLKYRQGAQGAFEPADQIESQVGGVPQQQQQQQQMDPSVYQHQQQQPQQAPVGGGDYGAGNFGGGGAQYQQQGY